MPQNRPKPYFSETEAARSLGISVEEFHSLLKRHIIERDDDLVNVPVTTFHASDLLILRMLSGRLRCSSSSK